MVDPKMKEELVNKALQYFNDVGWNCAESVYLTIFRDYYKMDVTPKTVTAYGGGIARTGSICGAVNVAIMGISQKYGRENPKQLFYITQRPVFEFLERISGKFGSVICSKITNCQLTTKEGIAKFRDEKVKEQKCTPLVREVIEAFLFVVEDYKLGRT